MTIEQRRWCSNAIFRAGSFVKAFAKCCVSADEENFKLVAPVLETLMQKYPNYNVD